MVSECIAESVFKCEEIVGAGLRPAPTAAKVNFVKIGIDVRKISDYGIGTHIRNVVLAAADLAPQHEFICYYDPLDAAAMRFIAPDAGTSFRWVEEPAAKYSIQEHISLARKARKERIGLFHSPHYTLPLFLNCPSIVTIHDLIHFKFQEYFPAWKVQAAKYVIRKATQKARCVIAVSQTTRRDLIDWMPALEPKIKVLYNRLSDEWFQPPPSIDLRSLGIGDEFLLYVGNFKKHKGIDTLVAAYRQGVGLPPLVLVGQNHHLDHELSQEILNTPNLRLLGFAEPNLLRALYSKALVFLFPSRYEGFGYPPLEAMAAGCPVLSSDAPAMKEILDNAAVFFEVGNAEDLLSKLREILSAGDRRKSLIRTGISQAKKFATDESPRKLVEEWMAVGAGLRPAQGGS